MVEPLLGWRETIPPVYTVSGISEFLANQSNAGSAFGGGGAGQGRTVGNTGFFACPATAGGPGFISVTYTQQI